MHFAGQKKKSIGLTQAVEEEYKLKLDKIKMLKELEKDYICIHLQIDPFEKIHPS